MSKQFLENPKLRMHPTIEEIVISPSITMLKQDGFILDVWNCFKGQTICIICYPNKACNLYRNMSMEIRNPIEFSHKPISTDSHLRVWNLGSLINSNKTLVGILYLNLSYQPDYGGDCGQYLNEKPTPWLVLRDLPELGL